MTHSPDDLKTDAKLAAAWRLWLDGEELSPHTRPYTATWAKFLAFHHRNEPVPVTVDVEACDADVPETPQTAPVVSVLPALQDVPLQTQGTDSALLFKMFGSLMEQAGWKPSTNGHAGLDEAKARKLINTVIDEHLANGHLRSTVRIQVNDVLPRELKSTPPIWFPRALRLALARVNVLLIGPS